jgi:hypothetical protein
MSSIPKREVLKVETSIKMKSLPIIFLFLIACQAKTEKHKVLKIPVQIEKYRSEYSNASDDDRTFRLYIPIDVSCATCLSRFSQINMLSDKLAERASQVQIIPFCYSKNKDFESIKYLVESGKVKVGNLTLYLDTENKFYTLNTGILPDQCIVTNLNDEILLIGDFLNNRDDFEAAKLIIN